MKTESVKAYVQGGIGAVLVAMIIGLGMVLWSHFWVDQWQSVELYRLRTQAAEEQKVQAEIVKWINGVVQSQQQQRPGGGPPAPTK